ncbi:hypothetical protein BGX27_010079 [Mortierella sp. AM989]|nr:hypothetical protein BGX27_010079 [Mortierella sp. AM989]
MVHNNSSNHQEKFKGIIGSRITSSIFEIPEALGIIIQYLTPQEIARTMATCSILTQQLEPTFGEIYDRTLELQGGREPRSPENFTSCRKWKRFWVTPIDTPYSNGELAIDPVDMMTSEWVRHDLNESYLTMYRFDMPDDKSGGDYDNNNDDGGEEDERNDKNDGGDIEVKADTVEATRSQSIAGDAYSKLAYWSSWRCWNLHTARAS